MIVTGIAGFAVIVAAVGAGLWALRRHSRLYPKGTRMGDLEQRPSGLRWIGWIYGGGRG